MIVFISLLLEIYISKTEYIYIYIYIYICVCIYDNLFNNNLLVGISPHYIFRGDIPPPPPPDGDGDGGTRPP